MSLKDTIQAAAKTAFNVASSLQKAVTFRHVSSTTYDPDEMTNTPVYENSTVNALVAAFNAREIDNQTILANDLRVVIEGVLLTDVDPADRILIDGLEYDIVTVRIDPADAAWILQVRR